jgi:hypothetical protein
VLLNVPSYRIWLRYLRTVEGTLARHVAVGPDQQSIQQKQVTHVTVHVRYYAFAWDCLDVSRL